MNERDQAIANEKAHVTAFLEELAVRPSKGMGQNFMVDKSALNRIANVLPIQQGETVLEVGPGLGALTRVLLDKGAEVIAIELEEPFVDALNERFVGKPVTVIHGDAARPNAIETALAFLGPDRLPCKVVGNLPYSSGTAILQNLFGYWRNWSDIWALLQEEVILRLLAPPDDKERGYLTVITEVYAEVSKCLKIGPTAFYPQPKVNSLFARLHFHEEPRVEDARYRRFANMVSRSFQQRRKKLRNTLPELKRLAHSGDDPTQEALAAFADRRPGSLSLAEYIQIDRLLHP